MHPGLRRDNFLTPVSGGFIIEEVFCFPAWDGQRSSMERLEERKSHQGVSGGLDVLARTGDIKAYCESSLHILHMWL
jgi:hypothetical protein